MYVFLSSPPLLPLQVVFVSLHVKTIRYRLATHPLPCTSSQTDDKLSRCAIARLSYLGRVYVRSSVRGHCYCLRVLGVVRSPRDESNSDQSVPFTSTVDR